VFVANILKQNDYDGIAHAFRHAGIPYTLEEKGTLRTNNVFLGLFTPPSRDRNYGMDVFVPAGLTRKAKGILGDSRLLAEAALREHAEGELHQALFVEKVLEYKKGVLDEQEEQHRLARRLGIPPKYENKPVGRLIREEYPTATGAQENSESEDSGAQKKRVAGALKVAIIVLAIVLTVLSLRMIQPL
jgi:hypothetical protein